MLVVNAGSSSLKLGVLERERSLASVSMAWDTPVVDEAALADFVARWSPIDASGHRIVHGGTRYCEPVIVDRSVRQGLEELQDLAPLHQPKSLAALDAVIRVLPGVPAVACFDTAFHSQMPESASTYALPAAWRHKWHLRRYGFHGLAHRYVATRVADLIGSKGPGIRVVTCHLGAGASLAAVAKGRSVDTTMGFTPMEGLVMATRSGSVDPGLLLWLEQHCKIDPSDLADSLEHRSGLLGLSGHARMEDVLAAEADGEASAGLAVAVYLHRLRAGIAQMAAAMGGLEAIAFSGGIGEGAPQIRSRAADGLEFLGIALDPGRNATGAGDREIGVPGAVVRSFVIQAKEDVEIARGVGGALGWNLESAPLA